jgi:hypothetical protein
MSGSKRTVPEFSMLRNFRTTAVFRITFRSGLDASENVVEIYRDVPIAGSTPVRRPRPGTFA